MKSARIDFESGFAMLKLPYPQTIPSQATPGSADMFKKASVLQDSNVSYAVNAHETNLKR